MPHSEQYEIKIHLFDDEYFYAGEYYPQFSDILKVLEKHELSSIDKSDIFCTHCGEYIIGLTDDFETKCCYKQLTNSWYDKDTPGIDIVTGEAIHYLFQEVKDVEKDALQLVKEGVITEDEIHEYIEQWSEEV